MGLIRILLAISVIIAHTDPIFGIKLLGELPSIAVQLFFVISGFYMALILEDKYRGKGMYRVFLLNRFAKLFPSYWVVCLCVLFTSLLFYALQGNWFQLQPYVDNFTTFSPLAFLFLVVSNVVLFFQDTLLFFGLDLATGHLYFAPSLANVPLSEVLYNYQLVPPAWSISLELMFYLIAPFLVRRNNVFIGALMLLSIALRLLLILKGYKGDPFSYRFFPTELVFFLSGIMSHRLYRYLSSKSWAWVQSQRLLWSVYVGIVALIVLFPIIPIRTLIKYPLFLPLFIAALPFIFLLSKRWKKDRYLGEFSYPLYISHWFVNALFVQLFGGTIVSKGWSGELCLLGTFALSYFLNKWIIQRVERYRIQNVEQHKVPVL